MEAVVYLALRRIRDLGLPFLLLATLSQVGASSIQQGIAVLSFAFRDRLHLTLPQTGGLVSATALGMMISMTLAGILTDRYGPRRVLIGSVILTPVAAFGLTSVQGYLPLLATLSVVGFALGAVPIAGARAIFFRFSGPRRGAAMGVRQTGVPLGAALAAAFLPAFAAAHGPYAPWLPLAFVASAITLAFALYISSPAPAPTPAARHASPLGSDLLLLLYPGLLGFSLAAGQYSLVTYTLPSTAAYVGLAGAGALLAGSQIGGVVGRIGFGALSDRLRNRPLVIAISAALGAAGIFVAPRLGPGFPYALRLAFYFLAGAGAIGWNALLLTWAGERVRPENAARAIGLMGSSVFAGTVTFPPLFGEVARLGGFNAAWLTLSAFLALAALSALIVARRTAGTRQPLGN